MAVNKKTVALFLVGAVLLTTGGVIYAVFPGIIESQVKENIQLKPPTMTYDNWKELAIPLTMQFYIFDVQNPDDVIFNGSKPILVEKGPYTYTEKLEKKNISFDWKLENVTYQQLKTYIFNPELSEGSESDMLTIPDVPLITAVHRGKKTNPFGLNLLLGNKMYSDYNGLYKKRNVSEIIFKGYHNPLVSLAATQDKEMKEQLEPNGLIPGGWFAFFINRNETDDLTGDGDLVVNTGVNDHTRFAEIAQWKGMEGMKYWGEENSTCNAIRGTDGFQYAPFITKDTKLELLVPELCRSVFVIYEKEVAHLGIDAYRFTTTFDMFADKTVLPENECYCVKGECFPSGLLNIAPCKGQAPIIASPPHFFMSDPQLLDAVVGMKPDPEKHKIILDVEPTTGTVIGASRKLQINIKMEPSRPQFDKYPQFYRMPKMIHPILWVSESASIDEENADKFKDMLVTPKKIGTAVMYSLMALGALLILISVGLMTRKKSSSNMHASVSKIALTQISVDGKKIEEVPS